MKKLMIFSALLGLAYGALAAPGVRDVRVVSDDVARFVTIDYTLTDEAAIVTVDLLTNGVSIGAVNFRDVGGDVNQVVQPGERRISWRPELSWPGRKSDEPVLTAEVKAWAVDDPPPYLVVWLGEEKKVRWYPCEDALPGGITSAPYRMQRMVMRRIPAAGVTWRMGSPADENGLQPDRAAAQTPHYVTLTNDYFMAVYSLTHGQYYYGSLGWRMARPSDPVTGVSYNELRGSVEEEIDWPRTGHAVTAGSFLGLLRARCGLAFDIPTEAEWEYACRAGAGSALYSGKELVNPNGVDENVDEIAWYSSNAGGAFHPVGLKKPNAWGLYDMIGNVSDWCLDKMTNPMPADEVVAPVGPEEMAGKLERVRRGGDWSFAPRDLRSGSRGSEYPDDNRANTFSARLVLPLSEVVGL